MPDMTIGDNRTLTITEDGEAIHTVYPSKLERVTARIAPAAKAPWDVLTADRARESSAILIEMGWAYLADILSAYADAVDAMTQPTRIEYETETA